MLNLKRSFYVASVVLKLGYFGKYIKNTLKVLKCGAEEGWRRSVGLIVWTIKYYKKSKGKEHPTYNKTKEG
jgi:hypothetical protein